MLNQAEKFSMNNGFVYVTFTQINIGVNDNLFGLMIKIVFLPSTDHIQFVTIYYILVYNIPIIFSTQGSKVRFFNGI